MGDYAYFSDYAYLSSGEFKDQKDRHMDGCDHQLLSSFKANVLYIYDTYL